MPRLTVLMGAPGSGKSTYAKRLGNVVTTDGTRERAQTPADALHHAYSEINRMLATGKNVVFDTTGANPAVRKAAVTIARRHGAQVSATVLATPVNICLESQQGRTHPVAAADVERIHDSVRRQVPGLKYEGFDTVNIVQDRK